MAVPKSIRTHEKNMKYPAIYTLINLFHIDKKKQKNKTHRDHVHHFYTSSSKRSQLPLLGNARTPLPLSRRRHLAETK